MNIRQASLAGIVSSLLGGASLFLVFRVSVEIVGASALGAWVMIQSAFVLSRISDAGLGINMTRLVAVEQADRTQASLSSYLKAGLVLNALPVTIIGIILIAPVNWLLTDYFSAPIAPKVTSSLIWLSFSTALISSSATAALSIMEGMGGLFHRHVATIASNILMMATAYPLITIYGPVGIGLCYAAGAAALLCISILILSLRFNRRRHQTGRTRQVITELWRQNLTASGMVLVRMTFEPWTKFLVASISGLAVVAALDLALRVCTQLRVAVQAATQPLLTLGARSRESATDHFHGGFARAHSLLVRTNMFLIGLQVAAAGLVSFLGFGEITSTFVLFFIILAIGNSINSLGVVGYFFDASANNLARLLKIHVMMMILNLALGAGGAWVFGSAGAVAAYAIALIYGGIALAGSWMSASGDQWSRLLKHERGYIAVAALLAAALGGAMKLLPPDSDVILATGSAALTALMVALFALRNWRAFR